MLQLVRDDDITPWSCLPHCLGIPGGKEQLRCAYTTSGIYGQSNAKSKEQKLIDSLEQQ